MPKGLKSTSGQIIISHTTVESAPNTFTQDVVGLQLNVLDREVFVCTALDIDVGSPNAVAGVDTSMQCSVSTVNRLTMGSLGDSNVMGAALSQIRAAGFVDGGVAFQQAHPEAPTGADLEYIGIIATNDFMIQVEGVNNIAAQTCRVRLWGYRAVADAATFSALVQSELLSQ